jgi:molybdate transport system regulatory protein
VYALFPAGNNGRIDWAYQVKSMAYHRNRKHAAGDGEAPCAVPGLRVAGRLWIECDGQTLLSWKRVDLLECIREHGSITLAAKSMGISYRNAWELIEDMNQHSRQPLVERVVGGKGGGGTRLTAAGEDAIARFLALVEQFNAFLEAGGAAFSEIFVAAATEEKGTSPENE